MAQERRDFNAAAATWDQKPRRLALAADVAAAIIKSASPGKGMKALDFGCGTGLLTLALAPLVGSITGADSSQGMLDVLAEKVKAAGLENVDMLLLDAEGGGGLGGPYDLISTSMTLHHLPDVPEQIHAFCQSLAPGGLLCAADLDAEGGLFHDDPTGVFHKGFDRDAMAKLFTEAGLVEVSASTAAEIEKKGTDGKVHTFTVFLVTGRKAVSGC